MIRVKKADLLAVANCLIGHLPTARSRLWRSGIRYRQRRTPRPHRSFWSRKWAPVTRPTSANCFWKSACWIRRISDPPPAATTSHGCRQTLPSGYGEAAKGRGRGTCRETRQKDEGGCQAEEPPDGIGRSP